MPIPGQKKRELNYDNPIVNQDPGALLAYDNAGRPRHDESCSNDFLLKRGVTPKKQWDVPADFQRPDRGGGRTRGGNSGGQNRKPKQQQNANPDTDP